MFQLHSLLMVFGYFILSTEVKAGPLSGKDLDPEIGAGKFEGDMLLKEEQLRMINSKIQGRNGLVAESKRWPNNIVYYKIAGNFGESYWEEFFQKINLFLEECLHEKTLFVKSINIIIQFSDADTILRAVTLLSLHRPIFFIPPDTAHRLAILEGIATIEARTCVRFQEASDAQRYYLKITSDPGGCYTAVGYLAEVQQMNLEIYPLNQGCFRTGTILHEFMHALGFYHQQSDAQRDDYVEILYENIIPGKEFNFEKYKSSYVTDFDVGYDYESCLHYGATAFSVNGKATLRARDSKALIGQRISLSDKDITKINVMYKCPIFI